MPRHDLRQLLPRRWWRPPQLLPPSLLLLRLRPRPSLPLPPPSSRPPPPATAAGTTTDTAEFTAANRAKTGGVQADKFFWYTLEWPLQVPIPDQESQTELQQLQQRLGFAHIGVVMGQVTETTTGKGKNKKTKRDFKATLVHMTKQNPTPGDTELKSLNWINNPAQTLKFGGETSAKKIDAAKKVAKTYVSDHGIYSVVDNSCNDFAQAVIAAVK